MHTHTLTHWPVCSVNIKHTYTSGSKVCTSAAVVCVCLCGLGSKLWCLSSFGWPIFEHILWTKWELAFMFRWKCVIKILNKNKYGMANTHMHFFFITCLCCCSELLLIEQCFGVFVFTVLQERCRGLSVIRRVFPFIRCTALSSSMFVSIRDYISFKRRIRFMETPYARHNTVIRATIALRKANKR